MAEEKVIELVNQALAHSQNKSYDRAIELCNEAIRLNPDYAEAYLHRGYAYSRKDCLDSAIVDYTKAIQLNPNYADAYAFRGYVYRKKGDHDRAIPELETALRIGTRNDTYVREALANARILAKRS